MKVQSRRESKELLERLGEKEIRARVREARRELAQLARQDPREVARRREVEATGDVMQGLANVVRAGESELERRAAEEQQRRAAEEAEHDRVGRALRDPGRHEARRRADEHEARRQRLRQIHATLRGVGRFNHHELQGAVLAADRLTDEQGAELRRLLGRRLAVAYGNEGAEPLTAEEQGRYEEIVGVAAGDPNLFQRKREEARAREEAREVAESLLRHPQAESLVAAVMSDRAVFDYLQERLRPMSLHDERGNVSHVTQVERVLELEHVGALFLLLNLIAESGGRETRLTQHGAVTGRTREDGRLPFIDVKLLAQLRRNRFLTTRREGSDIVVGLGERVRQVAKRWQISLPEPAA
jgi:hypothetical protein